MRTVQSRTAQNRTVRVGMDEAVPDGQGGSGQYGAGRNLPEPADGTAP
ncbi:hypothetical protein ACE1SV_58080 [Streptomyces sp. E-15]